MSWGGAFRRLWADAAPAGRRRATQLAVGEVRLDAVLVIRPRAAHPAPDLGAWAAGVRDDGTFVHPAGEMRPDVGAPPVPPRSA